MVEKDGYSGHSDSGMLTPSVRKIRVFLCYRRTDGAWHVEWLYRHLKDASFIDASGKACHLDVYYDKTAPGVSDWKQHHFPSLQASQALILVCTPGIATNFSKRGQPDWLYKELRWWGGHRDTAPIVVDATGEGDRWLPRLITRKWPDINRIDLNKDDAAAAEGTDAGFATRICERIIGAIRESEQRTVFEDLQRFKQLTKRLAVALSFAGLMLFLTAVQTCVAVRARDTAEMQRHFAEDQQRSAEQRRIEVDQARQELSETNKQLQEEIAEGRHIATVFIYELAEQIRHLPGSLPGRQRLVTAALTYLNRLAQKAGADGALLQEVAKTYVMLGDVLGMPDVASLGDRKTALESYQKAVEIYQTLIAQPAVDAALRRALAQTFDRIGKILYHRGETATALQYYQQALKISQDLVEEYPDNLDFQHDLSVSDSNVGDIYQTRWDLVESLRYYQHALAIRRRLVDAEPHQAMFQRDLAVTYDKLGDVAMAMYDKPGDDAMIRDSFLEKALTHYEQAFELRKPLRDAEPHQAMFQRDLAVTYDKLGDVAMAMYDKPEYDVMAGNSLLEKALTHYEQALAIRTQLRKVEPQDAQAHRDLTFSYTKIGDAVRVRDGLAEALRYYQRALPLQQDLVTKDQTNTQDRRRLASMLKRAAELAHSVGQTPTARDYMTQALALLGPLAEETTQATASTAGDANIYAWTLLKGPLEDLRNYPEALRYAKRAVKLTAEQEPHYLDTLAWAYHLTGDHASAVTTQQKAMALLPRVPYRAQQQIRAGLEIFMRAWLVEGKNCCMCQE